MSPLTPIYTAELFEPLHAELIGFLGGLGEDDWNRPTVAGLWRVRHVVGHLLDIDLRKLSFGRDRHVSSSHPASPSYADIVTFINDANASGVSFADRLSPRVMTDLLDVTGRWVAAFVMSLPPHAQAHISVLWAGEQQSENWMDIGREYTERWHHQMQLRDAVGAGGLLEQRWLHPLLDLSVRALPTAYASTPAPVGTAVVFEVSVHDDNVWSVIKEESRWAVSRGRTPNADASIRVDGDTAWKLLYNALSADAVRARAVVHGDEALLAPLIACRSVMV